MEKRIAQRGFAARQEGICPHQQERGTEREKGIGRERRTDREKEDKDVVVED